MEVTRNYKLLAIGVVPCVAASLWALFVVPHFNNVFIAAGVERPLVTRALVATFRWWGIAALVTAALWLFWPMAASRGRLAATFGVAISVALLVFGLAGCYAPIFALANFR